MEAVGINMSTTCKAKQRPEAASIIVLDCHCAAALRVSIYTRVTNPSLKMIRLQEYSHSAAFNPHK